MTTVLSILAAASFAAPAPAQTNPAAADAAIREFLTTHDIPSAHVMLLHGDQVILQRGYGLAYAGKRATDASSVFPIGSISKQFTAATILALADEGRLRLDAPVRDFLPEWFADDADLRITHLLSQTSLFGSRLPVRIDAPSARLDGNFEDGLFRYAVKPDGEALQVEIDLIGKFRFVPTGSGEYIAEELPATFGMRLPTDGSLDRFEFDWGEVRSYARRVSD